MREEEEEGSLTFKGWSIFSNRWWTILHENNSIKHSKIVSNILFFELINEFVTDKLMINFKFLLILKNYHFNLINFG